MAVPAGAPVEAEAPTGGASLRGCHLQTPYGWGICICDDSNSLHLRVALDWRLRDQKRAECAVRRSDIKGRSFCAAGECVLTTFGTGVLLGYRPSDGMHHVQLWGSLGRGRNSAYLRKEALLAVLPAAAGLVVETPYGQGICQGYRPAGRLPSTGGDGHFLVDLPWGRAVLGPGSISCPGALTLPLINRFLDRAADVLRNHTGILTRLRDAFQGMGLERLQARLTASAEEAVDVASRLWDEWEAKDGQSIVDNLKLKADEYLSDPKMKAVFDAGISRLNQMVSKAEGFDGHWIGKEDQQPRCTIGDAIVHWHWGEDSELEIWGADKVSTRLQDEIFRATMLPDGSLQWTDGDIWVRSGPLEPTPASSNGLSGASAEGVDGGEGGEGGELADIALVKRSLGDLRRIVGGEGLEGDVEEALSALSQVASGDGQVKLIVEEMEQRRELLLDLRGQVMQSKTGQVLQEGQERLRGQLAKLKETSITPQLERMQHRSQRFITRLTTDKKVKTKAFELFSAAQSRLSEKWNDPNDPQRGSLETWVTRVKERVVEQLSVHRAMLVEGLGGLDLQQLDARQLIAHSWDPVALEAHLEKSLVRAINLSGVDCSGTELLDRFESAHSVTQIPVLQRTYQSVLSVLGDHGIEVPMPIRKLLEAQAAGHTLDVGTWQTAIVSSLDDEAVVKGASDLVEQGERVLCRFEELKSSQAVAQIMEHLENEEIEHELLKQLHSIDADSILNTAEGALASAETREELVSQLKDACLDFVLKILPAIHIEKLSGNDNGCDWEISDISFSDFAFRKENVQITLGNPSKPGEELLRMSAWDISAHFRKLKVVVKQTSFPFLQAEGIADAKAERMSVALACKLQPSADGGKPSLVMSSRSVLMDSLELWVCETNYAVVVNALSFLFADVLKGYACQKIAKQLDEHVETLITALNSVLTTCAPLLEKLGFTMDLESAGEAEAELADTDHVEELPFKGLAAADDFPEEIDWGDPGRSFAVRV